MVFYNYLFVHVTCCKQEIFASNKDYAMNRSSYNIKLINIKKYEEDLRDDYFYSNDKIGVITKTNENSNHLYVRLCKCKYKRFLISNISNNNVFDTSFKILGENTNTLDSSNFTAIDTKDLEFIHNKFSSMNNFIIKAFSVPFPSNNIDEIYITVY